MRVDVYEGLVDAACDYYHTCVRTENGRYYDDQDMLDQHAGRRVRVTIEVLEEVAEAWPDEPTKVEGRGRTVPPGAK